MIYLACWLILPGPPEAGETRGARGVVGYVTKTISTDELVAAIHGVAAGEPHFSPRLAAFVLQAFSAGGRDRIQQTDPELATLTPREREVLTTWPAATPTSRSACGSGSAPAPWRPTSARCCASCSSPRAMRSPTGR